MRERMEIGINDENEQMNYGHVTICTILVIKKIAIILSFPVPISYPIKDTIFLLIIKHETWETSNEKSGTRVRFLFFCRRQGMKKVMSGINGEKDLGGVVFVSFFSVILLMIVNLVCIIKREAHSHALVNDSKIHFVLCVM